MAATARFSVSPFGNLVRVHSSKKFPTLWNHRESWIGNADHRFSISSLLLRQLHYHSRSPHRLLSIDYRNPVPFVFGFCSPSPSYFLFSSMDITTQASSDVPQSSSTKTVRVVIKGRVQGVFYRNWTIENANELGLKGWVRNRRDGSVEALFSGDPDSVQEMEKRCRRGPPASMVTSLQVFPSSDDPGTGFERKPTI